MKLRALFFLVLSLGVLLLVYVLISERGCCGSKASPVEQGSAIPEEIRAERVVTTLHFGDLMLDRGVENRILAGVDPFSNISAFITEGDFDAVVANLEGPFTTTTECQVKPYSFRFEPAYIEMLLSAGITSVTLANNHSNDCYSAGLEESRRLLSEAGIIPFGDDASSIGKDRAVHISEELGVAFLGFDMTLRLQSVEAMAERVEGALLLGARPIVHIHWGEEYTPLPNATQRETARRLSESGASLVIGHHPHVIEPAEIIGDTVVFYSLGNFIFDQETKETNEGYAVEERVVTDEETGELLSRELTVHPYNIQGYRPTLLEGEEKLEMCERVLGSLEETLVNGCVLTLR